MVLKGQNNRKFEYIYTNNSIRKRQKQDKMAYLCDDILWVIGKYVITYRNNQKVIDLFDIMPTPTEIDEKLIDFKNMKAPALKEEFKRAFDDYGRVNNNKTFRFYKQVNGSIRRNKEHHILELINLFITGTILYKMKEIHDDSIYSTINFKRFYEIKDGIKIEYTNEDKNDVFSKKCQEVDEEVLKIMREMEVRKMEAQGTELYKYYRNMERQVGVDMREEKRKEALEWRGALKKNKKKDILTPYIEKDVYNVWMKEQNRFISKI
jgi:hypothetical protein